MSNVVFSPDGSQLAVSASNRIAILRASNLKIISLAIGHTGDVRALSYSADGNYLLSSSSDGTARVWKARAMPDDALIPRLMRTETMDIAARVSATNKALARSVDGNVVVGITENGRFLVGKSRAQSSTFGKSHIWLNIPLVDVLSDGTVAIFSEGADASVMVQLLLLKSEGCSLTKEYKFGGMHGLSQRRAARFCTIGSTLSY